MYIEIYFDVPSSKKWLKIFVEYACNKHFYSCRLFLLQKCIVTPSRNHIKSKNVRHFLVYVCISKKTLR